MEENNIKKIHWNTKVLLNYVHEVPGGHHVVYIESLEQFMED
jgi:hypothetical protein